MENFIVSARKYRPLHFNAVVGQGHVTGTLKNAIKNNQLAQAFLFCGPRGVGKTTCARILAKTINCQRITGDFEACDECESCLSFRKGASMNIHELDAASNNSVDDIRSLVEQVRYPPQAGKYKIYIIDEVHMLSQSAFNAFLKTLEEPPSYAIFILATTEKHKIIPTILSRCQIFDFNRIKVEDISRHLAHIAKEEKIAYEDDGLHLIAQKSDGALRDALSMFDQIVSFSGGNLSYKAVIDNLNILDYDYYFRLTRFLLDEDIPGGLLLFDEILGKGFDGNNFINGLCSHFRNLLVCKEESTVQLLEVSENIRQRYLEQAREASTGFLLSSLNIGNQCDINYRLSKNPRLQVELALMKMCHVNAAIQAGIMNRQPAAVPAEGVKKKREEIARPGAGPLNKQEEPAEQVPLQEQAPLPDRAPAPDQARSAEQARSMAQPPPTEPVPQATAVAKEDARPSSPKEQDTSAQQLSAEPDPAPAARAPVSPAAPVGPAPGNPASAGPTAPGPTPAAPPAAGPTPAGPSPGEQSRVRQPASENPLSPKWGSAPKMVVPSLSGALKEKKDEEAPVQQKTAGGAKQLPSQPFNENQLLVFWKEYAAKMETEGRVNMHTLMTTFSPVLGDSFNIELKVVNKVQQDKFMEEKQDIMNFLRKKLCNYELEINTVLHEDQDTRRRLYTSTDKFNYLAEKNPSLIELRKRLDLDVDF